MGIGGLPGFRSTDIIKRVKEGVSILLLLLWLVQTQRQEADDGNDGGSYACSETCRYFVWHLAHEAPEHDSVSVYGGDRAALVAAAAAPVCKASTVAAQQGKGMEGGQDAHRAELAFLPAPGAGTPC